MDEIFDKMIYRALQRKATDIHLTLKKNLSIRFRVFGDLEDYDMMDLEIGGKLMNYIKYRALINTNYRLLPQTGDFNIVMDNKTYFLRISYLPSPQFESIVIRILNNHEIHSIDDLTYQDDIKKYLYWLANQNNGLFLISGATGSGKSTTLYTILSEIINHNNKNIVTIEDPIEVHLDQCLQIELNEKLGITYQDTLKQILRHDPDIIMIGEIRDSQTAKIAITCALTGHLVLTTIHASNSLLSLKRLINLGVNEIDIQDVVIGSMSQRIKYDAIHKRVVVLSELMNKQDIMNYFDFGEIQYMNFHDQALKLIDKGFDSSLFKGEIDYE
ncbi:MAG: Flp pilus assembly complex ATPase component TadA [Erysipelotrichaceae bacterium]|nr:Flp pilus assembly complex ATPase component TadA [Erysipelotrichaceae bacterium]